MALVEMDFMNGSGGGKEIYTISYTSTTGIYYLWKNGELIWDTSSATPYEDDNLKLSFSGHTSTIVIKKTYTLLMGTQTSTNQTAGTLTLNNTYASCAIGVIIE